MKPLATPAADMAAEQSAFKSRPGFARLLNAMRFSASGLKAAWMFESAFRQEVAIGLPLMIIAMYVAPGRLEALAMIGTIVLAWIVELLNSGLEAIADAVSLKSHPLLGRAKDLGSAAVMMSLGFAAITWTVILWPASLTTTF